MIALTGATGFVGQALLEEAAHEGIELRALTRREQAPRARVEWVAGDLADKAALARLVEGSEAVLHVAGAVNAPSREAFADANARGTERVVAATRSAGILRFVHVSSLAAREPALSNYGWSKYEGEQIVKASGLAWTIVRPPMVYGPRDTEVLQLFRAARLGIVPVPRRARTSVIHVEDLVRLLVALLTGSEAVSQRCFEPDDGRPGGWAAPDLMRAIGAAIGRDVITLRVPGALIAGGARLDRLIRGDSAKLTPDRAGYLVHPDWVCSPGARVPADLWRAQIATPKGLRQTADWYRERGVL